MRLSVSFFSNVFTKSFGVRRGIAFDMGVVPLYPFPSLRATHGILMGVFAWNTGWRMEHCRCAMETVVLFPSSSFGQQCGSCPPRHCLRFGRWGTLTFTLIFTQNDHHLIFFMSASGSACGRGIGALPGLHVRARLVDLLSCACGS